MIFHLRLLFRRFPNLAQCLHRFWCTIDRDAARQLHREGGKTRSPMAETGIVFATSRHDDVHAAQRVDGHQGTIDHNLLRSRFEKVGGKLAKEGGRDGFLLMKPNQYVGSLVLSCRVHDTRHGIHRAAAMSLHAHSHRSCHLCSIVQSLLGNGTLFGIVRKHHTHGSELRSGRGTAQHQRHIGHGNHHARICQSHHEGVFLFVFGRSGESSPRKHELASSTLRECGGNDARSQDEHHGSTHHIFVEQMLSVGQNDFISHHGNRQCRSRARGAQSAHHVSLSGGKLQSPSHQLRCEKFARRSDNDHCQSHGGDVPTREDGVQIDNHAHPNEEIGNEEGISHKLDALHQRSHSRDFAIEHDAHEEGTEKPFHSSPFHEPSSQEDQDEHEDILHHSLIETTEKPTRQRGHQQKQSGSDESHAPQ